MKLKQFLFALVAMMSFTFSAFAQTTVTTEAELKALFTSSGGGNIVLGDDITLTSNATTQRNAVITLDLNGHTITASTTKITYALAVGAKLTITDSGENGEIIDVYWNGNPSSVLTLEAGTLKRGGRLVYTSGAIVVNGGKLENTGSTIVNATNNSVELAGSGSLTVNGGSVSSVYLKSDSKVTVTGGTISLGANLQNNSSLDVQGGTINSVSLNSTGNSVISGGEFTNVTVADGFSGTLSISGGTFENPDAVGDYLEEGLVIENGQVVPALTGDGTEASPYLISDASDLEIFRNKVNAGNNFAGQFVKLGADIALSGEWTAIGNGTRSSKSYSGNAFKGTFDGDSKTISGLTITSTTGADAAIGLFGVVDGGTVKDVNLTNVNINATNSDLAGAAIGMMLGGATAENITVSGTIVGHDGVGGIVGRLVIDGTIKGCINNANVTSSYGGIGGIVGKAYYEDGANTSTFASIEECVNNGTVKAPMYVGGIVGLARANVTGCVNNGAVEGGTQTGGIVGQLIAAGTVSGNENKAKVSGKNHVGGIIGDYSQSSAYTYNNVSIANNINRGELTATEQCAAIMGCNNIDGFTAMTATGNQSYYYVAGLELFGNPEDMAIDATNKYMVTDFATLKAAVEAGANVALANDITTTSAFVTAGVTSVIDLNDKTLTIGAGDNKFNDESNITIKNGTVSITGVTVKGNAIFCLDEYEKTLVTTLTLDNVDLVGDGYSSAYGIFYIGSSSVLNVNGGEWNLKNDTHASGGVFKADASGAQLNIDGLELTAHNVRRVVTYAATTIENSTMAISGDADGVDAEMEHGFNRSPLAINNSTITMKDMVGRGITAEQGAVTISENSKVEMTNCQEATIDVRNNQTVTIDNSSTVALDKKPTVASGSAINGTVKLPTVAQIGDVEYADIQDALTAASAMSGDVVVEVYDKVTFNSSLAGNYTSIKFVGKNDKAEIYLDVQGYITATGKKVAFENLTLSKSQGGFINNAGFMNVAFGIYDVAEVTYTNCVFANGAYAASGKVTYTGCTFKRSWDKYGLWAYGDVNATVEGCTFADYRGIKMYAEGAAKTTDLTVKNTDFSAVTDKPAIVLTYGESVTLEGNTYSSTGTFELDLDGAPAGTSVTSDVAPVCVNDNGACGVLVEGKIYTTVAEAVAVATAGSNVTLLYSTDETVTFTKGVELTLADNVVADNVTVTPNNLYTYAEFNALIKANGNYDGTAEGTLVILKDSERSYQNNKTAQFFIGATNVNITDPVEAVKVTGVTFQFEDDDLTNAYTSGELQIFAKTIEFTSCTFIGTAVSPWGVSNSENAEAATFTSCTWKNLSGRYGVHQNRASNLTVTGCTFENCERGIHTNSSTPANITITNNTFTGIADGYGVLCLAENGNIGEAALNITGNKAEGQTMLRQLNKDVTYDQVTAILNTENNTYGTAYVEGSVTPVATINGKIYASLEAAIAAVKNGETITLVNDCGEDVTLTEKTGLYYTIDGAKKTMNGTITVKALSDTEDNRRITIKNINFVEKDDEKSTSFITSSETNHYPRLTIEDCSFTGSGYEEDKEEDKDEDVAITLKSAHSVVIKGCTGTGLHSFLQNTSGWNLTVENVTVTNSKSGLALGTVQGVTIKGCNIAASDAGYGIRIDANTYNNNAVIESNKVEAFIPVVVRKVNTASNITFNGTNTMTATNTDGKWMVIGTTEYEENGKLPAEVAGANVVVTINDATLSHTGVHGAGLSGKGTEAEPYLINNVAELVLFRNSVNAGSTKFNAAGVWVALTADIDLNNEEWTVGIGDGHNYSFDGCFDGKGKTIKNLNIKPYADESGYVCGGLFGYIYDAAIIKNLTIENATVDASQIQRVGNKDIEPHNVGVLVGFAYNKKGKANIDNITVKGNIKVDAPNVEGVGAIVGYSYGSMGAITNSQVIAADGSYIKGYNFVGGITGYSYSNAVIDKCTVENIAITATNSGVAGIAGLALNGNQITNCVVKDTEINGKANVAYIVGELGSEGGNVVIAENNNAPQPWVGGNYATGDPFVATIGTKYYSSIAKAIEAAKAGDNITLIRDVEMSEILTINKAITLDGNGKTLTSTAGRAINIETEGEVTIKNLTVNANGERAFNVINKPATLKLESVTATAKNYAVMIATSAGAAKVTIDGSELTGLNVVNVAGAASEVAIINGSKITNVDANPNETYGAISIYQTAENAKVTVENSEIVVADDSKKGYIFAEGATITGVDQVGKVVAMIGDGGYETLAEAIADAKAGQTVKVVSDVTMSEILVLDKAITLDGNGKTLTSTAGRAINVSGADGVTIKNLTISASGERAINVIQNATNVTIENVTATAANYTVNVASSAPNAKVAIKGSTLTGLNVVNVAAEGADVTVEGGTITCNDQNDAEGYAALSLNKDAKNGKITATGVTFDIKGDSDKASNGAEGGVITIDGSTDGVAVDVAYISYGSNYYGFKTIADAVAKAKDGETIVLINNVTSSDVININKSITIDGNGKTLTYTGTNRAIDVPNNADADIDVTVKNLTVVATTANRGINYNENGKFNVEGVTVTIGADVDGYAINFPGMADKAQVTIKNSKLTSRNPLNIWGSDMTINVENSEITSVDNSERYDYAAIQLNNEIPTVGPNGAIANGTVVNVYGGTITALNEKGEPSNVVANATETGVVNISDETVINGKVVNYVANIGGVYFATLQDAIDAVEEQGYTSPIVVMKDFATDEAAIVKNGLNVTIDLAGKTISVTDNTTKNFEAIKNQGTLTIKDSSADKTGKITVTATVNSGWDRYSAVIANTVGGKLTVEGGTIEHLGGTDMAYGIDNLTNGKGTYAETIINGGTIKSTYRAIRQFLNGIEAQNILTINGGTIEGANKSVWMHDPSTKANTGTLTVGENAKLTGDVYLFVTAGSTEWPVSVSIAAAALQGESKVVTGNVPAGYELAEVDGTYGVFSGVAKIGNTYYETVTAAINAAADGATVQLLAGTIDEYIAPWAGNSKHDTEKSITIVGAADFGTTLTGGMYLGYDDSQCREHNIVVKGINFTGKGLTVACQQNVTIEGNKFIDITEGRAIAVIGKDVNSIVKDNVIENVASIGIELRNTLTAVVEGNTIAGTGHNSLQITSQVGATNSTATVKNNTMSEWGTAKNASGVLEGRAMRINGIVTATVNNNAMSHTAAPEEFVKATGSTTLDVAANYWGGNSPLEAGMFAGVEGDPAGVIKSYYTDAEMESLVTLSASVAAIGNVYYQTLAEAVAAAKDGETVKLIADVTYDDNDVIEGTKGKTMVEVAGKSITLDMNGKTIDASYTGPNYLMSVIHVADGAGLTVTGNGFINVKGLNAEGAAAKNIAYVFYKSGETGYLTIENGTFRMNDAADSMVYTNGDEIVTINGGTFILDAVASQSNGFPVIFSTAGNNERQIVVNGGSFNYDINHQIRPFEPYVAPEKAVKKVDDMWTIVPAEAYITEMLGVWVHEKGEYSHEVGYATVAEAIAAVNELGNVITMVTDIELTETLTVPADKNVVLDLNGKTISQSKECTASYEMIKNLGNLTITDNSEAKAGKISFKDTSAGDPNFGWGSYTINNRGTLVVENGTIEHLGEQAFATHMICAIQQAAGSTTINGGTFSTPNYRSVRINGGSLTVNGGTFDGQVWLQPNQGDVTIAVAGGTFEPNGRDASAIFMTNVGENKTVASASITGGTFNGKIGCSDAAQLSETIKGGTFSETAKNGTNEALIATGYIWGNANSDGTYGVVVDPKHGMVAQIGDGEYFENQYFATINDAAQAAQTGDVIKLIADVEMTAANYATITDNYAVLVPVKEKTITIDLNGKNVVVNAAAADLANAEGKMLMSVFGIDTDGNLTIVDNSTEKTGSVKVVANDANVYSLAAAYGEGAKLTINDGSYYVDNVNASGSLIYAQQSECIIVNGGNFDLGNLGTGANGSPWIFNTKGQNYTGVIVNGGTYPTDINHQFWANEVFVPQTKALKNNGDGTWTVVDAVVYTNELATSRGAEWRHVGYASLEDAIAATGKYNCKDNTVTMLKDLAIEPITVTNGVEVAIDLNGKTISGTDNGTASFGLITNKGDLTITDSSEDATGKITLTATNNRGWSAYSSVISNQVGGKLTVNGGTIEHLGGTSMAWGIDNLTNGKGTYAETEINGGVVKSAYIAIRQFLNGVEAQNILTVNGGTLEGETASLYFQDPSKNANTGTLNVFEYATLVGDVYLDVTAGSTEWPVEVYIEKAALGENEIHTENVPEDAAALVEYDTFWQVEQKNLATLTIEDDCEEYINKIEKNVGELTYERYFDDTEWQTIILPFDVPVANLTADFEIAYIYNAGYKNEVAVVDYVVIDENSNITTLAANYPYLIKAKVAGNNQIVVNDAKLMPTAVSTIDCSSIFEKFSFIGTYATVDAANLAATKGYFDLNAGAWSKMGTVNPFRFYMQIELRNGNDFVYPASTESIRMRRVDENGNADTTGIDGVDADQNVDFIFDLHGRRVLEPLKGQMYIINGKKVLF